MLSFNSLIPCIAALGLVLGCSQAAPSGDDDDSGECEGCIDDEGRCIDEPRDEACGTGGVSCDVCASNEFCSEDFFCEDTESQNAACNPLNCDGCCDGDECVGGTANDACGNNGEQCSACAPNATCQAGGVCGVDTDGTWNVTLENGEMPEKTLAGGSWDGDGNEPDPYVIVEMAGKQGKSGEDGNTLKPEWNAQLFTDVKASDITDIKITIYDNDRNDDDFMGSCTFQFDVAMLASSNQFKCDPDAGANSAGFTVSMAFQAP